MVAESQPICAPLVPCCAACTANTIVKLLAIRTTVLIVPRVSERWFEAASKACG